MPDFDEFTVKNSIPEVIFAQAARTDTDINSAFETDGAKKLIFFQTGTRGAVTPPTPDKISGNLTLTNPENTVDGDLGTSATATGNQNSAMVYRWDFGSIATRILGLKLSGAVGAAGTNSAIVVAISDDDIIYVDIADTTPPSSSYNVTEEVSRSFRFVRVTLSSSGSGGTFNHTWFEVYDATDGLGSATFQVEQQDPETLEWQALLPTSDFDTILSSLDPTIKEFDATAISKVFPVGLDAVRGRLITTGKVSSGVNLIKVF